MFLLAELYGNSGLGLGTRHFKVLLFILIKFLIAMINTFPLQLRNEAIFNALTIQHFDVYC